MLKITTYLLGTIFITMIMSMNTVHAACGTTWAFCGRGINSVACCDGYVCDVAPNDAYAHCIPNTCGGTGAFCGRGVKRVNCCKGYECVIAPNDASASCTLKKA